MESLVADQQRRFAVEVVTTLRDAGYESYWAGGCVRDHLLGRVPHDYDVATNALPDQVRACFGKRRTLAIGAAFGVISVIGPRSAGQVEVATFREDGGYSDGRRPDRVTFSSAREDALRRDFTINGMFLDPLGGQVIDFVGGQQDLEQGVVRAIGVPRLRFTEDKLRMLRAVRFAAVFDFRLDPDTLAAIKEMAGELPAVSAERIAVEMHTMLVHPRRTRALELLGEAGLLAEVLPELDKWSPSRRRLESVEPKELAAPDGGIWGRTLSVAGRLHEPSLPLALAAVLHAVPGAGVVGRLGKRWRLSRRQIERTAWLVAGLPELNQAGELPWSRLQPILTDEGAAELLALHEAATAAGFGNRESLAHCRTLLARPADELNPAALLTGSDLIARGVPRGSVYSRILSQVRAAQLDGHVTDKSQALALVEVLLKSH